jgi:hypothetical protein
VAEEDQPVPPGCLPGDLGLLESQVNLLSDMIEECLARPRLSHSEMMGALQRVLIGLKDEDGPANAVYLEMAEWQELLYRDIAYRCFALGLEAVPGNAGTEGQAG